jgi:hypothetical protein
MIHLNYIAQAEAWTPSEKELGSFGVGVYQPCRILGPARLVRLLSHAAQAAEGQMYEANREDGPYWFEEADFLKIKAAAAAELKAQGRLSDPRARFKFLVGMYMRHELRNVLAVSRDWTPSFDYYLVLAIPAGASVIALEGTIGDQPVYSNDFTDQPTAAGMRLIGGLRQYVIRFDFPANQQAVKWFEGPPKRF